MAPMVSAARPPCGPCADVSLSFAAEELVLCLVPRTFIAPRSIRIILSPLMQRAQRGLEIDQTTGEGSAGDLTRRANHRHNDIIAGFSVSATGSAAGPQCFGHQRWLWSPSER